MIGQDERMRSARPLLVLLCCLAASCLAPRPRLDVHWRVFETGAAASLRGIAPVSRSTCYVGGAAGSLRKTVDAGRSWVDVAPPGCGDCDFRDLEVIGDDVVMALVAGAPARLYRSADRGATWRCVYEDPRADAFLDAMAFKGNNGVVFGDAIGGRFVLLATSDGGASWRDVPSPGLPVPAAGEAAFAASGTCVSVGPTSFALVTGGDRCRYIAFEPGKRPFSVDLPMLNGAASRGAFSVAWRGQCGVCVGGDYRDPDAKAGSAAVTTDGGRTWAPSDAGGYRSCALWISDRDVLAVGPRGASWSEDAGRTYADFGAEAFHSVAQAPDGAVWACGARGRAGTLSSTAVR